MKKIIRKIHLQYLLKQKSIYKWTCTVQICVVQGSVVYDFQKCFQSGALVELMIDEIFTYTFSRKC